MYPQRDVPGKGGGGKHVLAVRQRGQSSWRFNVHGAGFCERVLDCERDKGHVFLVGINEVGRREGDAQFGVLGDLGEGK